MRNGARSPSANFAATIYHGIPADLHQPDLDPRGGYVAFLGRISPEKRPDRAIAIARTLGIPLKIAAKVDKVDEDYFRERDRAAARWAGRRVHRRDQRAAERREFLGEARALLFPIDWPEPFGLAMIEAMACGTPVLAFRRGSVPEIIDEGVTGVIVETWNAGDARRCRSVLALDRRQCGGVSRNAFRPRAWRRIMSSSIVRC